MHLEIHNSLVTERLNINILGPKDAAFIFELLNTAEWKQFIGDRNINNMEDAEKYIRKINDNATLRYWVVATKSHDVPVGIITLISRDYLEHPDIGFAFLPQYANMGYAFEAAKKVLDEVMEHTPHKTICAITVEENTKSIRLLEKLGLRYNKKIQSGNESLLLYDTAH